MGITYNDNYAYSGTTSSYYADTTVYSMARLPHRPQPLTASPVRFE